MMHYSVAKIDHIIFTREYCDEHPYSYGLCFHR